MQSKRAQKGIVIGLATVLVVLIAGFIGWQIWRLGGKTFSQTPFPYEKGLVGLTTEGELYVFNPSDSEVDPLAQWEVGASWLVPDERAEMLYVVTQTQPHQIHRLSAQGETFSLKKIGEVNGNLTQEPEIQWAYDWGGFYISGSTTLTLVNPEYLKEETLTFIAPLETWWLEEDALYYAMQQRLYRYDFETGETHEGFTLETETAYLRLVEGQLWVVSGFGQTDGTYTLLMCDPETFEILQLSTVKGDMWKTWESWRQEAYAYVSYRQQKSEEAYRLDLIGKTKAASFSLPASTFNHYWIGRDYQYVVTDTQQAFVQSFNQFNQAFTFPTNSWQSIYPIYEKNTTAPTEVIPLESEMVTLD